MMIYSCAHRVLFALLYLFAFSLMNVAHAADIKVKIDRNPVDIQESFQIIFTANESPDDDPDFSSLNKDFEILNQAEQQSTQIINWKRTKSIQWVLTVMAKRTGNLIVPAIHFGKDSSRVTAVIVKEAQSQTNANSNEDLFLQASVDNDTPYIQEQVSYTLKIFSKINVVQAQLVPLELSDAVTVNLSKQEKYIEEYNGESYEVTEIKYLIFPQKSGSMTIAPLTLTAGIVLASQRRNNSFFSQQRTRNKRFDSNSIHLNVQAKPANQASSVWLPAEQVEIAEKWSIDPQNITLGEPVTRTVRLLVKGVTVSALPELHKQKLAKQIKGYPDQPILKETLQGNALIATREEKIALIASEVGTYTLPAIEIPWWNTLTETQEMAVIPEKQFIVVAGELSNIVDIQPAIAVQNPDEEVITEKVVAQPENKLWFALALFFGSAWLLTLLYLIATRKANKKIAKPQKIEQKSSGSIKLLKQACADNDRDKAKQALLAWGREHCQKNNLAAIAKECDSALSKEIQGLNMALYSKANSSWQGEALWQAFQKNEQLKFASKQTDDGLPPLFKI